MSSVRELRRGVQLLVLVAVLVSAIGIASGIGVGPSSGETRSPSSYDVAIGSSHSSVRPTLVGPPLTSEPRVANERSVISILSGEINGSENATNTTDGDTSDDTADGTAAEPMVIGTDDRKRVSNTKAMPYSSVVKITTGCSGVLIDADHVLTAAHCVYDETKWSGKINPSKLRVFPGVTSSSEDGLAPYGVVGVESIVIYPEYANATNNREEARFDIALLELDRNVGRFAGNMTVYEPDGQDDPVYFRNDLEITGYPTSSMFKMMFDEDKGSDTTRSIHEYRIDTSGGQSGGPVWTEVNGVPKVLSVHANAAGGDGYASGTRISRNRYDDLNRWRNRDSSPTDRPDLTTSLTSSSYLNYGYHFFLGSRYESPQIAPDPVHPGGEMTASIGVRNAGTASTGCFDITLYRGASRENPAGGDRLGSKEVCSLSPFTTKRVEITVTVPSDILKASGGTMSVGWVVDSNDDVLEFGEAGNGAPHAPNSGYPRRISVEPAPPIATYPAAGATDVSPLASLSWENSGSGVAYEVYLTAATERPEVNDLVSTTNLVAEGISTTGYDPALDADTQYYWTVVAEGPNGNRVRGSVRSFTTAVTNVGPSTPSNPTPADGTSGVATSLTLSWSGGDPDGDGVGYDVYFGTSSDPPLYTSTGSTSVSIDGLQQGTTYYWRVVASDGIKQTTGTTWSFTTASAADGVTVDSFALKNEYMDGPLKIHGSTSSFLDEGYLEYVVHTSDDGVGYDLRVIDERGILVGVESDTAYDGDDFAVQLGMNDGAVFRRPGTKSLDVVVNTHGAGEWTTTTTADIGVERDSDKMVALPANPRAGETVTLNVSHITRDSGGTDIEGYDWQVIKHPDGNAEVVKDVSGSTLDQISFTADEAGEYYVTVTDTASTDAYDIDTGSVYVESDPLLPDLNVGSLSVPGTVTAGESFSASIDLSNVGDAEANYIARFKIDGVTIEAESQDVEPGDTDTGSESFTLPAGTYDISVVIIDAHNNKHTLGPRTVTVEPNTAPDAPGTPTPGDGDTGVAQEPTLDWSGGDLDGDSVTYTVRLESGDVTPDTAVASGIPNTSYTPSPLKNSTTYYWQVVATDEHRTTTRGPVWEFTTPPATNSAPTARLDVSPASPDAGAFVELNATGSTDPDENVLSYQWEIRSSPDSANLSLSTDTAVTSFRAAESGTYVIELTVSDGEMTDSIEVSFTAADVTAPTVGYVAADNPSESTVEIEFTADESLAETEVKLTAENGTTVSTLTEADFAESGSGIRTYTWTGSLPEGTYTVELVRAADDAGNDGASGQSDAVVIDGADGAPTADAGADRTVAEGTNIELDATGSVDPDGDTLSYDWTQTGGPSVSLQNVTTATPVLSTPEISSTINLSFELTVSDGNASDTDTVYITVEPMTRKTGFVNATFEDDLADSVSIENYENWNSLGGPCCDNPEGTLYTYVEGDSTPIDGHDPLIDAEDYTAEYVSNIGHNFIIQASGGYGEFWSTYSLSDRPEAYPDAPYRPDTLTIRVGATDSEQGFNDHGEIELKDAAGNVVVRFYFPMADNTGGFELNGHVVESDRNNGLYEVRFSNIDWQNGSFDVAVYRQTETGYEDTPVFSATDVAFANGAASNLDTVRMYALSSTKVYFDNLRLGESSESRNQPPMADAGTDRIVEEGTDVALDATGSSDPDGDSLSYGWTQTGGPTITLQDADTATPTFTAPAVDGERTLTFEVTVSDGIATDTDTVTVAVGPANDTSTDSLTVDFEDVNQSGSIENPDSWITDQDRRLYTYTGLDEGTPINGHDPLTDAEDYTKEYVSNVGGNFMIQQSGGYGAFASTFTFSAHSGRYSEAPYRPDSLKIRVGATDPEQGFNGHGEIELKGANGNVFVRFYFPMDDNTGEFEINGNVVESDRNNGLYEVRFSNVDWQNGSFDVEVYRQTETGYSDTPVFSASGLSFVTPDASNFDVVRTYTQSSGKTYLDSLQLATEATASPSPSPGTGSSEDPDGDDRYEDVTGDGSVNIIDVSTFLEGFEKVDEEETAAFDFNGDGTIDILDVAALLAEI